MKFDLKKAIENEGKCIVVDCEKDKKFNGIIVFKKYRLPKKIGILVLIDLGEMDSPMFFTMDGKGYDARLENVPE